MLLPIEMAIDSRIRSSSLKVMTLDAIVMLAPCARVLAIDSLSSTYELTVTERHSKTLEVGRADVGRGDGRKETVGRGVIADKLPPPHGQHMCRAVKSSSS